MTKLRSTTSIAVIDTLKSLFARHGTPDVLVSDNGPQYDSQEFQKFCSDWSFEHVTSSPYFPRSNGLTEESVKVMKLLIQKAAQGHHDLYKALQAYRAAPLDCGLSPAQLLMGRRIKTALMAHPEVLKVEKSDEIVQYIMNKRQKQAKYYNHRVSDLPLLRPEDQVRVRDIKTNKWIEKAVVQAQGAPRSYLVSTEHEAT